LKTLTIIITDGPYISEYAEMDYGVLNAAAVSIKIGIMAHSPIS